MRVAALIPVLALLAGSFAAPAPAPAAPADGQGGEIERYGCRYRYRPRPSRPVQIENGAQPSVSVVVPPAASSAVEQPSASPAPEPSASASAEPAPEPAPSPSPSPSPSPAPAPSPSPSPSPAPAPAPPASNGAPDTPAGSLLQLHNDFRALYGAGPLTWNDELAGFAQQVANTCVFKHSGGPYGENLAAGAGGNYSPASGFNAWANEHEKYDWNNPGFASATGHFTQVVWKATTELGCAVAECADGTIFSNMGGQKSKYVVCEYRRPGNMVGNNGQYFRDNVGTRQG